MANTSKGLYVVAPSGDIHGEVYDDLMRVFGNNAESAKSNMQKIDDLFVAQEQAIASKVSMSDVQNAIATAVTTALNNPV